MNLVGFEEAYRSSITVKLSSDPRLEIKVPTLPSLALMKIVSWRDRYPNGKRDAQDLLLIMQSYEEAGNLDRLYEEEQSLLKKEDFDTQLAGIRLLGRDLARAAEADSLRTVKKILQAEIDVESDYRIVNDMIEGSLHSEEQFSRILEQVEKLLQGITEASKKSS
jgi:predicted nucleotidyltransferase